MTRKLAVVLNTIGSLKHADRITNSRNKSSKIVKSDQNYFNDSYHGNRGNHQHYDMITDSNDYDMIDDGEQAIRDDEYGRISTKQTESFDYIDINSVAPPISYGMSHNIKFDTAIVDEVDSLLQSETSLKINEKEELFIKLQACLNSIRQVVR